MGDDYALAKKLQEMYDVENVPGSNKKDKRASSKSTLIDPEWELCDPNPNIYNLFQVFNSKFFWNALGSVEVKWSPRMYSCAGICTYKGRGGCIVSLSLPLLKLRPRKDLIETLLHEMIHAYLFVTKNNKDRTGHGPEFHKHMNRINSEAGTNITVYHTFHDEVRHYKTHWWRCNGPCKNKKPYFGLVKRSMNRAPGPNDFWFAEHQQNCGGEFIKIKEPEGFKSRKPKITNGNSTLDKERSSLKDITHYFPQTSFVKSYSKPEGSDSAKKKGKPVKDSKAKPNQSKTKNPFTASSVGGNSSVNNVVGFVSSPSGGLSIASNSDTRGGQRSGRGRGFTGLMSNMGGTLMERPKAVKKLKTDEESSTTVASSSDSFIPFSGAGQKLGSGGASGPKVSRLLSLGSCESQESEAPPLKMQRTDSPIEIEEITPVNQLGSIDLCDSGSDNEASERLVNCPACNERLPLKDVDCHLDSCGSLDGLFDNELEEIGGVTELSDSDDEIVASVQETSLVQCPCCNYKCPPEQINEHLDDCLK